MKGKGKTKALGKHSGAPAIGRGHRGLNGGRKSIIASPAPAAKSLKASY
jgi:hypothetical protein